MKEPPMIWTIPPAHPVDEALHAAAVAPWEALSQAFIIADRSLVLLCSYLAPQRRSNKEPSRLFRVGLARAFVMAK